MRRLHTILIKSIAALAGIAFWIGFGSQTAHAGVIFNFSDAALGGGSRWDAAPRIIDLSGKNYERSLNGGLRYSVQGGSYEAFRDLFAWSGGTPSVAAFQTAVEAAFNAWTVKDPVSGLGTSIKFIADFATPVEGFNIGKGGLNTRGAEIDLFGSKDAFFWDAKDAGTQGETSFGDIAETVTLTSGTKNYAGSKAISGADIILNSNAEAKYTLDVFRRLLSHEIGHALGLGDVEGNINGNTFIDDNFDVSTKATALATLTNSWAHLVNPFNPAASVGLKRYTVPFADPGTKTKGVDILMESKGLGIDTGNPVTNLFPLTNDDFGTRQFLYPVVPEPATLTLCGIAIGGLLGYRFRRGKKAVA